jgi:glycopeptide antibiotics resistance protein
MVKNKHFLPAYVFGVLLLIGASLPSGSLKKIQNIHRFLDIAFSEYSLHFFGFRIFAGLLAWAYYQRKSSGIFLKAGLISFCFGLLIEIIHYFLPYRSAELSDLILDTAGIALVLGLFWLVIIRRNL